MLQQNGQVNGQNYSSSSRTGKHWAGFSKLLWPQLYHHLERLDLDVHEIQEPAFAVFWKINKLLEEISRLSSKCGCKRMIGILGWDPPSGPGYTVLHRPLARMDDSYHFPKLVVVYAERAGTWIANCSIKYAERCFQRHVTLWQIFKLNIYFPKYNGKCLWAGAWKWRVFQWIIAYHYS